MLEFKVTNYSKKYLIKLNKKYPANSNPSASQKLNIDA
jgi:hypothetical protein